MSNDIFEYLQLPQEIKVERINERHERFILEPINEGFATTIGNALRRVLLSSIQGIGIVGIKIDGVEHEFSGISGVKEDVINIILNLKEVVFKNLSENFKERILTINKNGPGVLKASDIVLTSDLKLINPNHYIAQLNDDAEFKAEIYLKKGVGYKQSNQETTNKEIGYIPIDTLFTPIRRVSFSANKSMERGFYDYERLVLDVETDGSITPKEALGQASYILNSHFKLFMGSFKEPEPDLGYGDTNEEIDENLLKTVEDLELNVRASNCLRNHDIKYIWQLVQKTDLDLLNTRNFGKQSLKEIKAALKQMGLSLGMTFDEKYIKRIEEAIKRSEE
ncbi:DNA-directed RNA polymerase subunit alpha [Desulfurella sp.]|uniref:DNA-directed RNA polymerase subunit alpha n=1 Tax=Desulfurella sp. TaxID=1962857 RepID=UPI003D0B4FEE